MKRALSFVAGVIAFAALWQLVGTLSATADTVPQLSAVLVNMAAPETRGLLLAGVVRTAGETVQGLAAGALAGIVVAALGRLIPAAAPGLGALASIVNGIPIIAVAGICVLALPRESTPIVVATLAAAFIVFVGATAGFATPLPSQRDVFEAAGASRAATFARLDLPSALPSILAALRAAAPVSVVGAILGEWFVAEAGLGPMLIAALQNLDTVMLWSVASVAATLSIALSAFIAAMERLARAYLA